MSSPETTRKDDSWDELKADVKKIVEALRPPAPQPKVVESKVSRVKAFVGSRNPE